jgi:hypothetical protein
MAGNTILETGYTNDLGKYLVYILKQKQNTIESNGY